MHLPNQREASSFLWNAYSETEVNEAPLSIAKVMMAGFNLSVSELTYVILKHNQANMSLSCNRISIKDRPYHFSTARHSASAVVVDRWDWCNDILIQLNQLEFEAAL